MGRRVFSSIVIGTLLLSGALLINGQHEIVGGVLLASAIIGLIAHWIGDALRTRRKPRPP
jgi:hypothetical protein